MTVDEFRRAALALPGTEERAHQGHPDFRVGGKIFATVGYPDERHATLMLAPQDQDLLIRDYPNAFMPASGAWGSGGATVVVLRKAPKKVVAAALESAWRRRALRAAQRTGKAS